VADAKLAGRAEFRLRFFASREAGRSNDLDRPGVDGEVAADGRDADGPDGWQRRQRSSVRPPEENAADTRRPDRHDGDRKHAARLGDKVDTDLGEGGIVVDDGPGDVEDHGGRQHSEKGAHWWWRRRWRRRHHLDRAVDGVRQIEPSAIDTGD